LAYFFQIAAQETCPADLDAKCGDDAADDWEGEFFPGISKIKYEVRQWKFRSFKLAA
jgi:xylose isomerase